MNRITRIAAVALSFAAAGSAFAESPLAVTVQPSVSTLSRAEVAAQARAVTVGEAELNRAAPVLVARSRADVRAETMAAIASGEVQAYSTETNAFGSPFTPVKRGIVEVRLLAQAR